MLIGQGCDERLIHGAAASAWRVSSKCALVALPCLGAAWCWGRDRLQWIAGLPVETASTCICFQGCICKRFKQGVVQPRALSVLWPFT